MNDTNKVEGSLYRTDDVQKNLQLIKTYSAIIKSPRILDEVREELNLALTTDDLIKKITVESQDDSQVVSISVQDKNQNVAANIANSTAIVFQKNIEEIMNMKNVTILTKASKEAQAQPIKPDPILNMLIALFVGLIVGIILALLLDYMDATLSTEKDVAQVLEPPVLGVIPNFDKERMTILSKS